MAPLRSLKPSHRFPYEAPPWCQKVLTSTPMHGRLRLANLPTPLFQIPVTTAPFFKLWHDFNISLFIKRDDCTGGVELGGNKVRKLEFLLAEALAQGCDTVLTMGGEQSNHARATAAAARMVGLEPHLILRTARADEPKLGLTGNLLVDHLVGSTIYVCTPGEYGRIGSDEILARVAHHLKSKGKKPFSIPVGGSNGLGTWGYINGVAELVEQWEALMRSAKEEDQAQGRTLDHVVFACGSGGTASGIALGIALAYGALSQDSATHRVPRVHAIGVCDDPDYFYRHVSLIAVQMGLVLPTDQTVESFVRQHMTVYQGKGLGYAQSTPEELDFVKSFARETGVLLDPVYSGKALFNFWKVVEADPMVFQGQNILFWHTGGALGMYDKVDDLESMGVASPSMRLDIYGGKKDGIDISRPAN